MPGGDFGIKTFGPQNKRYVTGICYVVIPGDVDRSTYIQNCLNKGTVCVIGDDGSFIKDVPVSISVLDKIDFPLRERQLGSCLIYVNEYIHNKPIVIGRLLKDDESTSLSESEFRLEKYSENGSVSISGSADVGNLFINVDGASGEGGRFYLNVSNPDNSALLEAIVQGAVNIELDTLVISALTSVQIGIKDLEPAAKANALVEDLEELIDGITELTVSTAFGPSGTPINTLTFTTIKDKLDEIKSQLITLQ